MRIMRTGSMTPEEISALIRVSAEHRATLEEMSQAEPEIAPRIAAALDFREQVAECFEKLIGCEIERADAEPVVVE